MTSAAGNRQGFTVSIDPEKVQYVELRLSRDSRTLTMDENREELISLIDVLNGSYRFYDKMDVPDTDGGYIAYSIRFFDYDGDEIYNCSVGYNTDLVYVHHDKSLWAKAKYYRFQNTEHDLDFPFDALFNS